jgi:formylmethanofuran:tetrahydromethanopterin formyltransferase
MKAGISAAAEVDGVCKISAGNYEGKLGQVKLQLREIVPELFK